MARDGERKTPVVTPAVPRVRPTLPTPEIERLREEWDALEESRLRLTRMERDLAARLDELDVSRPIHIPPEMLAAGPGSRPAPDAEMPTLTSSSPIPVRLSLGTWIVLLSTLLGILGTGTLFVVQTREHTGDQQRHLDSATGIGWGAHVHFESRADAKAERDRVMATVERQLALQQAELIRVLGGRAKFDQWRRERPALTAEADAPAEMPAATAAPAARVTEGPP